MRTLLAAALTAALVLPAAADAVTVKGRPHDDLVLAGADPVWWESGGSQLVSAVDGRRRVLHRDTTSCIGSYRHLQASGSRVAAVHTITTIDPKDGGCYGAGSELLLGSARAVHPVDLGECARGDVAIDGRRLLTGDCGAGLAVRELGRAAPLGVIPPEGPLVSTYGGSIALGGRYAAYAVIDPQQLVMFDWRAGKEVGRWSIAALRERPFVGDLAPQVRITADGTLVASIPPYGLGPHWLVWARAGDKRLHRVPFRKYGTWGVSANTIAAYRVKPRSTALFTLGGRTERVLAKGFGSGAAVSASHVAWITATGGTIRVTRR
jgi:hypothetical protein